MRRILLIIILMCFGNVSQAQDFFSSGNISGSVQFDAQYYQKDSLIDAMDVPEKLLSNGHFNLFYQAGNFRAGARYESYMNPLLGYDPRFRGNGIPYLFAEYTSDFISVTAGDFYEQFGSGIILRAYQERMLGFDNAIEGFRIKVNPIDAIEITGLWGKQRSFWSLGDGIVRAGDINVDLNLLLEDLMPDNIYVMLGASVVSKNQQDREPFYYLPENVLAYSTRFNVSGSVFNFDAEYAFKYNDPNATNKFKYSDGYGIKLSASYFPKGLGINVNFHKLNNMDFRSDRNVIGNDLNLNYLPAITKQHAYNLPGLYPHATQLNGEIGVMSEVNYTFPKESIFGGRYPLAIQASYSRIHSIDTNKVDDFKYSSPFPGIGNILFFEDFSIEFIKRWSQKIKTNFAFTNIVYNKDVMENEGYPLFGKVYTTSIVADLTYYLSSTNALRTEVQHLWSKQDSTLLNSDNLNGNWLLFLAEYTIAPAWYLTVYDEYNYGNEDKDKRLHYVNASVAYTHSSTRISLAFGRQRGGILCVGGVCRWVPSSNGFRLGVSTSF